MTEVIKLSKRAIVRLLDNYNIGRHISHKYVSWALSNSVYFLKTSNGRFVLKVHQDIGFDRLRFVQNIIEYSRGNGIPVAEVIRNNEDKQISLYDGHMITIQKFVNGRIAEMTNEKRIRLAGNTAGMLDRKLFKIPLNGRFSDYSFFTRHVTKRKIYVKNFDFLNEESILHMHLRSIKIEKLRKSVIHSDLGGHIMFNNGEVSAIIDWDDVKETYLVLESANFIADCFIVNKRTLKGKVAVFLKEYQKYVKLNKEEKVALYYLIKLRYLMGIFCYIEEQKTHKNKEINKWIDELLEKYKSFDRISLNEFMQAISQ
jgi:homoserine kinase type II